MTVTIWHNPKCSKSREVLALLQERGHLPHVVEYLKTPPSRDELEKVAARAGGAEALLRRTGNEALLTDGPQGAALLDRMARHPELIERPVVITAKGAAVCRPSKRLEELL